MKLNQCFNGLLLTVFSALASAALLASTLSTPAQVRSQHLAMGNPSQAVADPSQKDNFLMVKQYFALSYNDSKGTANWVSWHLVKDDLGSAPRKSFRPDQSLPEGFTRITPMDYTGAGFDRGHMCPHSDRSATDDMSEATFVMSNMIPQSSNVNQKAWAQLELYCRNLVANSNKTLYIVAGPAGTGGVGIHGPKTTIGPEGKITVPAKCWKVIMVLDAAPGDDLEKLNQNTRLIAVIIPNDLTVGEQWSRYRFSVKDVEKLTGYKFFDKVPDSIIDPLKGKPDDMYVPPAAPIHHGNAG